MYRSRAGIVSFLAVFSLTVYAIALIGWPQAALATEEGDEALTADSAEPSVASEFIPVTLDDLRCDDDLTVVQDSNGPAVRIFKVCKSVSGYADFEPNPIHEFARSLFGRAWLYTEIDEISSRAEPDGKYSFSLSADIVVSDADARVVWKKDRAISFDQSRQSSCRYGHMHVPTILRRGEYNVEITINDNSSGARSRVNTLVRIK